MINQEDLVLKDIERLKKIQLIMQRLGIEPDGWWRSIDDGKTWFFTSRENQDPEKLTTDCVINIPTYRQDKLALALPDWLYLCLEVEEDVYVRLPRPKQCRELSYEIHTLMLRVISWRGQEQLQATADLLILLEEEGLLK